MKRALLAGAALAALWGIASPAHAGTMAAYCGPGSDNSCETASDAMVFLEKADGVTLGFGNVGGQKSLPIMDIQSTGGTLNMIIDLKNGFASIDPTKGETSFNGLTFSVPGFGITHISFSAQLADDTFVASVVAHDGSTVPSHTFTDQPNSSQGYGVTAGGGEFDSVTIDASTSLGFEEVKHIEVSLCAIGSSGCVPVVFSTPEPTTLALLGGGLIGLGLLRRRTRR